MGGEPERWLTIDLAPRDEWEGAVGATLALVHSAQIKFRWKDQGWGNRKGVLSLRSPTASITSITSTLLALGAPASHVMESAALSWCPEEEKAEVWLRAGGGGGHELTVEDLRARVVFFDRKG